MKNRTFQRLFPLLRMGSILSLIHISEPTRRS